MFPATRNKEMDMKIASIILTAVGFCLIQSVPCEADMGSANYRITTTVISGGGGAMASDSYRLNGTLGQPSPLIDPQDPPWSDSYDLLTGFWYTLGASAVSLCPADFQPDGRVDGDDLAILAATFGHSAVGRDVDGDVDMDGRDLWEMAIDFNRNDCFP
jgi:hypothetical protein